MKILYTLKNFLIASRNRTCRRRAEKEALRRIRIEDIDGVPAITVDGIQIFTICDKSISATSISISDAGEALYGIRQSFVTNETRKNR